MKIFKAVKIARKGKEATCLPKKSPSSISVRKAHYQAQSLPSTLQNRAKLLGQHHVTLDLELARHECLHAIKLALSHCNEVSICQCDGHISLVFTPLGRTTAILQIKVQLVVTNDELEHSTSLLHKFCTLCLHSCFNLFKD